MAEGTTDFIGHAVALQPNDDYFTQACEPMNTKCQSYLGELWSRSERADFVRFLTFNALAMSVLIQTASSLFVSTCTTGIEMKSHDGVSLDRPVFQRGMLVCVPPAVVRSTSSCRPAMPTVGDLARRERAEFGCLSLCFEIRVNPRRGASSGIPPS